MKYWVTVRAVADSEDEARRMAESFGSRFSDEGWP